MDTLAGTKFFPARTWPALTNDRRGYFTEEQALIGGLRIVRQINDPGASNPRFEFLDWTINGEFKYVFLDCHQPT